MENEELFIMYLKEGEYVLFESVYDGYTYRGKILNNYKNGEFRVEFQNGIREEIIGAEQILFYVGNEGSEK